MGVFLPKNIFPGTLLSASDLSTGVDSLKKYTTFRSDYLQLKTDPPLLPKIEYESWMYSFYYPRQQSQII